METCKNQMKTNTQIINTNKSVKSIKKAMCFICDAVHALVSALSAASLLIFWLAFAHRQAVVCLCVIAYTKYTDQKRRKNVLIKIFLAVDGGVIKSIRMKLCMNS